jgi:L-serine dehydratase
MTFDSIAALIEQTEKDNKSLWEVIFEDDLHQRAVGAEESFEQMKKLWLSMKEASMEYDDHLHSPSGLSGGDGAKMRSAVSQNMLISGPFIGKVIAEALKMGESNACMKRIVAAPTAGSCGVLPAVLIPLAEKEHISDDEIIHALFIASGFGEIIAMRATLSGAEGGCQAEIGAASAMAAAALVSVRKGTPAMCAHACAMALKNLLGLVCDPVAGLVEVPCIKRNVIGALNAIGCADMALAGIKSRIPPDEVIDAMRSVGNLMSPDLKETSLGGLAQTPTGIAITERLNSCKDR